MVSCPLVGKMINSEDLVFILRSTNDLDRFKLTDLYSRLLADLKTSRGLVTCVAKRQRYSQNSNMKQNRPHLFPMLTSALVSSFHLMCE